MFMSDIVKKYRIELTIFAAILYGIFYVCVFFHCMRRIIRVICCCPEPARMLPISKFDYDDDTNNSTHSQFGDTTALGTIINCLYKVFNIIFFLRLQSYQQLNRIARAYG